MTAGIHNVKLCVVPPGLINVFGSVGWTRGFDDALARPAPLQIVDKVCPQRRIFKAQRSKGSEIEIDPRISYTPKSFSDW